MTALFKFPVFIGKSANAPRMGVGIPVSAEEVQIAIRSVGFGGDLIVEAQDPMDDTSKIPVPLRLLGSPTPVSQSGVLVSPASSIYVCEVPLTSPTPVLFFSIANYSAGVIWVTALGRDW